MTLSSFCLVSLMVFMTVTKGSTRIRLEDFLSFKSRCSSSALRFDISLIASEVKEVSELNDIVLEEEMS